MPNSVQAQPLTPPDVMFSQHGDMLYLHLGSEWVQGAMRIEAPFDIAQEYLRRMMAWLLFCEPADVPGRHAMQLGMGGATLTKFHFKRLRMRTTAVEINPKVVAACRSDFHLPPDGAGLTVVIGDAAAVIRDPEWIGTVDALQVDLYDDAVAAPVLDSAGFYADCRSLLSEAGVMAVSIFGAHCDRVGSIARIAGAFGAEAVRVFDTTPNGQTVLLAVRAPKNIPSGEVLAVRAQTVERLWGLPASEWLPLLRPVAPS
ncbi:MAG: spermidine synthase [Comamonadaceae bacterium]|nr:MAG: spermidine synthase [Comamonadaceae bacterium]